MARVLPSYQAGKRDLRLDVLRGAAIVAMVIDHIGGDRSWLYALTGGDRFYVSAAEVFVSLSGFVAGLVYTGLAARMGLGAALMKFLRRALVLYVWTVALTLALPLIASKLGLGWDDPLAGTSEVSDAVSVLTLHSTYHLTDVLLMYVFLFGFGGLALALIVERRTALLLGLSWGAWLAWQLWPQYVQWPWFVNGMGTFSLTAWQVLFFTGLALGAHRHWAARQLRRFPPRAYLVCGGLGLAASVALFWRELEVLQWVAPSADPQVLAAYLFSKADLAPGRLVVLAFGLAFLFSLLTLAWRRIAAWAGWLLIPLGQHALSAYALHLLVVAGLTGLANAVFGEAGRGIWQNTVLQLTGVAMLWLAIQGLVVAQDAIRGHSPWGKGVPVARPRAGPAYTSVRDAA